MSDLAFSHGADLSYDNTGSWTSANFDTTSDTWAILKVSNYSQALSTITDVKYNGVSVFANRKYSAAGAHNPAGIIGVFVADLSVTGKGVHAWQVTWSSPVGYFDFQTMAGTGALDAAIFDATGFVDSEPACGGTNFTPTAYVPTSDKSFPIFLTGTTNVGTSFVTSAASGCTQGQGSALNTSWSTFYGPISTPAGTPTAAVINLNHAEFVTVITFALKPAAAPSGSIGSAAGVATVLAIGASLAVAVGSAAGIATVTGIAPGASLSITLNGSRPYFSGIGQMFPYTAALSGPTNVTVAGTYSGPPPTHVQYRLGGTGSYATVGSEVISGGNWSGTIPSVAIGDIQLQIQESNNPAVNIDVANTKTTLGLGDMFGIIGDSEGLMPNAGNVAANGTPAKVRWLHPTNGWVDWDLTSQFEQGAWAYFGNEITARRNGPCFILNGASSGTSLPNWRHGGGSAFDAAATLFGAANGGLTGIICANLGTNDARQGNGLVTATVTASMQATCLDAATYMPLAPIFWVPVAELDTNTGSGNLRAELDTVRKALTATVASGSCRFGGFLQDQAYTFDGLHPDANDLADIGRRHFLAITDTLYGTTVGAGPRIVSATIDSTKKIIAALLDRDLSNTIASNVTGFTPKDGGVSVAANIVSQVVTGIRTVTITLSVAIAGTPTLDFASGNDAKGATVPTRAVETLPSGATTQRILQYFSDQAVIAPGSAVGSASGSGVAVGVGKAFSAAIGLASGAATVVGFIPVPFNPSRPILCEASVGTSLALKASVN